MISHNISQNKKTLENPQEFYAGFFNNILKNEKIINKKPSKD